MSFLPFHQLPGSSSLTGLLFANGSSTLTAFNVAANKFLARASAGTLEEKTLSDYALTLLDDTTASAWRTTLGLELSAGQLLVGNASNYATPFTITGDISFSGLGVATIGAGVVTNAKLATASANTLKGNATASTAADTDITISANQFLARASSGNIAAQTITDLGLSLVASSTAASMRTLLAIPAGGVTSINNTDSPYTVVAADKGKLILVDDSSAAVTVNLPAAATIGSGFYFWLKKTSASNYVLVDGYSAETVDGRTSAKLLTQYDSVGLYCDGSNWHVFQEGYARRRKIFTSTGANTFTTLDEVPLGATHVLVRVWGGGSGGGNGAGGGGGYSEETISVADLSTSQTATVGAAGINEVGGTSSFGSFLNASGGQWSTRPTGAGNIDVAVGGIGSGGDLNARGGSALSYNINTTNYIYVGGDSPQGGGIAVHSAGAFPGGGGADNAAANGLIIVEVL